MPKVYIVLMLLLTTFFVNTANGQVHAGIKFGTASYTDFELGYTINENLHIGLNAIPNFGSAPNFYGVYVRKSFEPFYLGGIWDRGIRPYLTGTVGYMPEFKTTTKAGMGGFAGGGFELFIDADGKMTIPLEIGLGKMPSANIISTAGKVTNAVYFSAGTRFYF